MAELSNIQIFRTSDGSPTLMWSREDGYGEKMHHSGGALSESLFIYDSAIQMVLERQWTARVISLGLGLGYNEWIALARIIQNPPSDWKIWSFESNTQLVELFTNSLEDQVGNEWTKLYREVRKLVAQHFGLSDKMLLAFAKRGLDSKQLELRSQFPSDTIGVVQTNCIFYDAYSKRMHEALWEENLLSKTLEPLLAEKAVVSSYAATGSMTRALKSLGFRLVKRAGFQTKRGNTLAIRE